MPALGGNFAASNHANLPSHEPAVPDNEAMAHFVRKQTSIFCFLDDGKHRPSTFLLLSPLFSS